jgi:hypothetical protein
MVSDERSRLIHRTEDLRRLAEGITDSMARVAISEEIGKHEALIAEIDKKARAELSADQPDVAKAPNDIIS